MVAKLKLGLRPATITDQLSFFSPDHTLHLTYTLPLIAKGLYNQQWTDRCRTKRSFYRQRSTIYSVGRHYVLLVKISMLVKVRDILIISHSTLTIGHPPRRSTHFGVPDLPARLPTHFEEILRGITIKVLGPEYYSA